jgi:hypothetical protein
MFLSRKRPPCSLMKLFLEYILYGAIAPPPVALYQSHKLSDHLYLLKSPITALFIL